MIEQPVRKTIYQAKAGEKSLTVVIEGRSCNDSMSGEAFETTVQVQLNQIGHQGCGRALHWLTIDANCFGVTCEKRP